jgi:hypothetical protein
MELVIASLVLGIAGLLAFRVARIVILRTLSICLAAIVELLRAARCVASLGQAH